MRTPSTRCKSCLCSRGDRLVFLTDGALDRNAAAADVAAVLAAAAGQHPREMVRWLTQAVLHATDGQLRADATMLCFDWYGGPPRDRGQHAADTWPPSTG